MEPWVPAVMVAAIMVATVAKWFFRSPLADAMAEQMRQHGRRRRHWKGLGGEWTDAPPDDPGTDERTRVLEERLQ